MLCRNKKNITRTGLVAMSLTLLSGTAVGNPDFGIDNDAEYQQLVDAMRAAEYVRADSINAEAPNPRVFAAVAGLMAFTELNPDASDDQLALFVDMYNTSLASAYAGDSMLVSAEHLIAAMQFTRISDSALAGLDTRVGEHALGLLGITIPDPDGFESIQRRMVRYETALARPVNQNRTEVYDLLVQGFYGQDASGAERAGLSMIMNDFLLDEGLDAAIGTVRADRPAVEDGLAVLPGNYIDYQASISVGPMNDMLQLEVQTRLESVTTRIGELIARVDTTLGETPEDDTSIQDGLDATQADIDAMLALLQADLEANNEARAAASAATMLMLQSQFDDIGDYASYTRDYSSITLETNDTFAIAQSGLEIGRCLTNLVLMADDGAAMIDNTFGLISESIGLASLFNSGPSVDEQIFEQVVELRQQVEEMRQEMNERFDRIDQQLNIMFDSMMAGFNALGDQIGDLQTDVDGLVLDMAATRSQLRRLEASLYGVAEDILLTDLTSEANIVLDFRDENGVDLPYNGGSPDFITASENFFTYANVTALSEAFAGSRSNPTLTASNADETVGSGPVARRINDLVVLPQSFGLPALASTDLVGLEPWSQAAAAYSQLAKENPWYFAYRYGRQIDDYNADPQNESLPELDRTIQSGDRLVSFIEAIREVDDDGNSALFDALTENYRQAAAEFQSQVDAEIASTIPDLFTNGSTTLDYWQFSSQNIEPIVPRINAVSLTNHGDLSMPSNAPRKGYRTLSTYGSNIEPTWTQTWHTLRKQEELEAGRNPDNFKLRGKTYVRQSLTRGVWQIWLGNSGTSPDYTAYREIEFAIQLSFIDQWIDWPVDDNTFRALVAATWPTFDNYVPLGREYIPVGSGFYNAVFPQYRLLPIAIDSIPVRQPSIQPRLFDRRVDVRNHLLSELLDPNSTLSDAAGKLDDAEALIDAYVSLGMPEELNQSDPLRSALRAAPGTSDYGLRTTDVITLILDIDDADSPDGWADQSFNVNHLDDMLIDRIDLVEAEIEAGLQRPAKAPGYVGYMIAELNNLRDTAFELSVDDSYTADTSGFVEVTPAEGLLRNDVMQEFTTVLVDTAYELDPAYVAPQHGQLTVSADGSLSYQADPGFVGSDSFTYRATATVNGTTNTVYSAPATVVIKVSDPSCNDADLATPYGELNFFDVSAFLVAFNANDPAADFNADGQFNFFDVSGFLSAFGDGCP